MKPKKMLDDRPRFRNRKVSGFALVVAAILALEAWPGQPALAAGVPGKWLEVQSPHFIVVSNSSRRTAMETAEHFEQIREIFTQAMPGRIEDSGRPLRVFAVNGDRTMKHLLPAYWERKGGARPSGVFRDLPTGVQVVTRADLLADGYYGTVYHEYFHYLVHTTRLDVPLWLNEGLATYWASTRLTKKAAEVGRLDVARLEILRNGSLMPIEELVAVERSSTHYSRSYEAQRFYAQSWALTHYLMVGDRSGKGREQLNDYLRRVGSGESSLEAASHAFGDLKKLRLSLLSYIRKVLFPYLKLDPPTPLAKEQLKVRELSRAEATALVALFLVEGRRTKGVAELVSVATEGAPERAESHLAAGLLHAWEQEYESAEQALARAVSLPGADSLAHYALAVVRFYLDPSAERLPVVAQHLDQALALNPRFAPAKVRLAEVIRRTNGCSQLALTHIREARILVPDFVLYRLKEAQLLLACGEVEAAQAIVRAVVEEAADSEDGSRHNTICWQGSLWGFAREALPSCDRAVALEPESFAILDSRGVARAIVGDLEGAAADLRAALEAADQDWDEKISAQRSDWARALEAGENPLVGDGLARFRDDPEETELDWWL